VDAAIRASIAIPGVISPYVLDGRLLADGGILDPLPMAPIAAVSADPTIAISLSCDDPDSRRVNPESHDTALNRMWRSTSALLDPAAARTLLETSAARSVLNRFSGGEEPVADEPEEFAKEAAGAGVPKLGGFEVMTRTIDIAQAALARHTLAAYPPDLLIEVPRTACRSLDYHRADELIDVGRELAAAALDSLAAEQPSTG
jgi:NTE family protein